jgi:hypothetical protein
LTRNATHGRLFDPRSSASVSLAFVVLVAVACTGVERPAEVFAPSEVGVIESIEGIRNMRFTIRLEDGTRLDVDLAEGTYEPASRTPNPGDLFVYVDDVGGKPWMLAVAGQGECFMVQGRAIDDGDHLVFESGLRLPKAADFDPGSAGPLSEYTSDQAHFCINGEGVVTHFAGSPG